MNDYTSVDIDGCAEEICTKLGVSYETHRDDISDIIDSCFGTRLREHAQYVAGLTYPE